MGGKITGGSGALVAPSQAANTSIQTVDTEDRAGALGTNVDRFDLSFNRA